MAGVAARVAKANARGPTSGFTDVSDDEVQLPAEFDRQAAKLFTPLRVGAFELPHRIIHAALGRSRSANGVESPLAAIYFAQRATPGALIISQATGVNPQFTPWAFAVELDAEANIKALRSTIDAVHAKGGLWFQQLFHVGRSSSPGLVKRARDRLGLYGPPPYGYKTVSASDVAESGINTHSGEPFGPPHPLEIAEIKGLVSDFKRTAQNAVEAGADGIEILSGNGFLLDQFLHDNVNKRTDQYGGSEENRARFALEVVDAVAEVVGYQKIGVRISPFSNFHETDGSEPLEQLLYLARELAIRGVAYIQVGEARVSRNIGIEDNLNRLLAKGIAPEDISLRPFLRLLRNTKPSNPSFVSTVLFGSGGYTPTTAILTIEEDLADAVVFGRRFISNPDLIDRIRYGYPLTPYDRSTFYTHGPRGYTTYTNYKGPKSQRSGDTSEVSSKLKQTSNGNNGSGPTSEGFVTNGTNGVNGHATENKIANAEHIVSGHKETKSKKVAIIGAGISGIASASAFRRLGGFDLHIFERKSVPGGSWVFDPVSSNVPVFPAPDPEVINPPQARPAGELPANTPRNKQQRFTSTPLYEQLRANIPFDVMSGGSTVELPIPEPGASVFLTGAEVSESVAKTAHQYDNLIRYNTTLEDAQKLPEDKLKLLFRRENEDGTDTWYEEDFDHLIVATGHNSVPRVPKIADLETWTGSLSHATTWRSGEEFRDKTIQKILIVGSSESAVDVALQSVAHAKSPVYVSQRTPHPRYPTVFSKPGIRLVTTVSHFDKDSICLNDGTVLTGIDHVVFATGYFYTYPFFSSEIRPPAVAGHRIPGTYQHIFDIYNQKTIAFIGAVNGSLAWLTWEKSAFLVALLWSGRIELPPLEEQKKWEARRLAETSDRMFHILAQPYERVLFFDELNELAWKYLQDPEVVDDALLESFPYQWMVSLSEARQEKLRFYSIEEPVVLPDSDSATV